MAKRHEGISPDTSIVQTQSFGSDGLMGGPVAKIDVTFFFDRCLMIPRKTRGLRASSGICSSNPVLRLSPGFARVNH